MKLRFVPPYIIRKIFSSFQWESAVDKVLFTFDDGPLSGNTELILKKLDDNKIKGIFFLVGSNIQKNPAYIKEILSEGHTIGNHTYHHKSVTVRGFSPPVELEFTNKLVFDDSGYTIKYFRPPHGKFNRHTEKMLSNYQMKNIMWSLLTYDFNNDISIVKKAVSNYLQKNSIVVFHDNLKSKDIISDSIDITVDSVQQKGFMTGSPEECLN